MEMEHNEAGCQAPPEAPKLCDNNCGFFGSAATMNLCSKCHKDLLLKSAGSIANGGSSNNGNEPVVALDPPVPLSLSALDRVGDTTVKDNSKRCNTCRKRVGLTGFNCRCGNLFCAIHRHSDKHSCPFDYRTAARDAIAKANPVVKAEKVNKI